jgi:hypothetical protein
MLLPFVDEKKIDKTNAEIDSLSKVYGKSHRKYLHSPRDQALLSIMHGDPEVFVIGQIHSFLDQNKNLQKLLELLE